MSEELTLLPCPACGYDAYLKEEFSSCKQAAYSVCCRKCELMTGLSRTKEHAVQRWNALLRALTWTNEPPKVPGYYWCRYKGSGKDTWSPTYIPACADHTKYTILFKSKDVEWAGPIPEPREPKEQGGYDG